MIAINDNYADGRDMSWLWDVDFARFKTIETVSGVRAYDMATRLQYDGVEITHVDTSIAAALKYFLKQPGRKRIFCTYTAMLKIRRVLASRYQLEDIE
jgi:UDP-N-acetylmuramyl tripeptide synthase